MPKTKNENKYIESKIIKSKVKKRSRFMPIMFFVLATIMLIYFIMNIVSHFSGISILNFWSTKNVVFGNKTYYVVMMDSFDNYNQAENMAELLNIQGASGFVWNDKNNFEIVGNFYNTQKDAQIVVDNLSTTNEKAYVKKVVLNKKKIKFNDYSKAQVKVVQNANNYLKQVSDSLYEYTIKIDTKEITPTTASSYVNNLKSQALLISMELDLLNSEKLYPETLALKNLIVSTSEILNELVLKLIKSENTNHVIKYSFSNFIKKQYDFVNSL